MHVRLRVSEARARGRTLLGVHVELGLEIILLFGGLRGIGAWPVGPAHSNPPELPNQTVERTQGVLVPPVFQAALT